MGKLKFKKKNNLISCTDMSFCRVLLEYMCWVLGGKPDNYIYTDRKKK